MKYIVAKSKGNNQYYVCEEGVEDKPLSRNFTEKKKALKEAAKMSGIEYKDYMKCYRKERRNGN